MNPRWWWLIGGFNALLAATNIWSWLGDHRAYIMAMLAINLTAVGLCVLGYRQSRQFQRARQKRQRDIEQQLKEAEERLAQENHWPTDIEIQEMTDGYRMRHFNDPKRREGEQGE